MRSLCFPRLAGPFCAVLLAAVTSASGATEAAGAPPAGSDRINHPPEVLDNPPAAVHPRQDPLARSKGFRLQVGSYFSVQVNVDEQGRNIVGDAANEPSLAVSPVDPANITVVWRQFDSISSNFRQAGQAYSLDRGMTWTFPGSLAPGLFHSDPVVDVDAEGTFFFAGLRVAPYRISLFRSEDEGISWSRFETAYAGDKEWLSVDRTPGPGHGHAYTTWQPFSACCGNSAFSRSLDEGVTFQPPVTVARNPYFGTMAVGPDGEVYIGGFDGSIGNGAHFAVAKSVNARNPLTTPAFTATSVDLGGRTNGGGPNPGGLSCQPTVVVDSSTGPRRGHVYFVGCVGQNGSGDPLDVVLVRSTDGGATWSAPIRINDDIPSAAWQWFAAASVAPNGRLDVVWYDTRFGDEHNSQLFYAWSYDGGANWSRNVAVSPLFDSWVGWPNQNKIGDYIGIVSNSDGAHVAYSATFNGEQDVYYVRLFPDCDVNGVPDEVDIATGGRSDSNGNGFPDDCELLPECVGTGSVPDGSSVMGQPLSVARASGGAVRLAWGAAPCAGAVNYAVYEGTIGAFASHVPRVCSTGGGTSVKVIPSGPAVYYLVASLENGCEGSYGLDSSKHERRASAAACAVQRIASCP